MSEFILPNYTESKCSEGPKSGGVNLGEFIVRWDYNGDGQVTVSLNNENDKLIQSIEHTKSKVK
jgi:hypothetical protein